MKRIIIALMALAVMASCSNEKKILVLYYSQTGATKAVAEEIGAQLGADVCGFDVEEVYDGDFDQTVARCLQEREAGFIPTLKEPEVDIDSYDIVFLGYPIWFGTYAPPVAALLKSEKFEGKTVVPFCTFGSGGLNTSSDDLKKALPYAEIAEGYGVRNARIQAAAAEVKRFLVSGGFIEGTVDEVPDYSQQQAVTDEGKAIFDEACGDYQFPLGQPVSCGSRETPWGTEYMFMVENGTPDGQVTESTIYVTVSEGKSEFTQVVR